MSPDSKKIRVQHFNSRYVGSSYILLHTVGLAARKELKDTSIIISQRGVRPNLFTGTTLNPGGHLSSGGPNVLVYPGDGRYDEICSKYNLLNPRILLLPMGELWRAQENRDLTSAITRTTRQCRLIDNQTDTLLENGGSGWKELQARIASNVKIGIPDDLGGQALRVNETAKGPLLQGMLAKIEEVSTKLDREVANGKPTRERLKQIDGYRENLDADHSRATAILENREAEPYGTTPAVMIPHLEGIVRREEAAVSGPMSKESSTNASMSAVATPGV